MRRKQARGKPLTELTKGSFDYLLSLIKTAFYRAFNYDSDGYYAGGLWIVEVFADFLIVQDSKLPPDEFYYVPFSAGADGGYTFPPREEWEVVELTYQLAGPVADAAPAATADSRPTPAAAPFVEGARRRVDLSEAIRGELRDADATSGARRIVGYGVTADQINGNRRLYPRAVLEAAFAEARQRIASLGGRALLGEAEHPGDKSTPRANFLETVVRWDAMELEADGRARIEGVVVPTSKGLDAIALMEHGVMPGISQRAWGYAELATIDGVRAERITELHIDGYDLVLDPADPNGTVTLLESRAGRQPTTPPNRRTPVEDDQILDLSALRAKYPHLVAQIESEHDAKKRDALKEALRLQDEQQRAVSEARAAERAAVLAEAKAAQDAMQAQLDEATAARQALEAAERRRVISAHVATAVAGLKGLSEATKQALIEDVQADEPKDEAAADAMIARRAKLAGAGLADASLQSQGFNPAAPAAGGRISGVAPVIERVSGQPAFAAPALAIQEALRQRGYAPTRNLQQPANDGERLAARMLARYDALYGHKLAEEARLYEAETTADLNIPYAVSRAVIAEAVPQLVAASVFDTDTIDTAPTRIYYEQFVYESGANPTVTDEAVAASNPVGGWVQLANRRLSVGTVVVTNSAGTTTYVEGTDYLIDYGDGMLASVVGGAITAGQSLLVDYQYLAIRKGEMQSIERGKVQLGFTTLDVKADRLAAQISREAIVFSRAQIGWDAVTRTIQALIERIQRKIDQDLFMAALHAVLQVPSNSGGTWTASGGDIGDFVAKVGLARVKVANRFYTPSRIVMSLANADRLANPSSTGNAVYFTPAGAHPANDLTAEGYVGRIKGLPVFATTNFRDDYVLVVHPEIVHYRVFEPMRVMGPYPSYDMASGELIAADQYYVEQFSGTVSPIKTKGSFVKVA